MNGHSMLILYAGLAWTTVLSIPAGANPNHIILILLGLLGALTYVGWKMARDLSGINIILFGRRGTGGLFDDITNKDNGLLRSRAELAQSVRTVAEQNRAVIRALAESQTQDEVSLRMRTYLTTAEAQSLNLEHRMRALELSPFVKVK